MAEVMSFDDLKEAGTEIEVRNKGRLRQEGRKYEMADGDIVFFKFGAISK